MRLTLVLLFLLLLLPCAVYANSFVPTLETMFHGSIDLLHPRIEIVTTLAILISLILTISLIEALAISKYRNSGSFMSVFWGLCKINAITTIISGSGSRTEDRIWITFATAFIITIFVQALLVGLMLKKQFEIPSLNSALLLSGKINLAGYGFIALVVLGLVYIPVIGAEQPEVLAQAHGLLIIQPASEGRVIDLQKRKFIIGEDFDFENEYESADCCAVGTKQSLICAVPVNPIAQSSVSKSDAIQMQKWISRNEKRLSSGDKSKSELFTRMKKEMQAKIRSNEPETLNIIGKWISDDYWESAVLGRVKAVSKAIAISNDGRLLVCKMNDEWVIYDWKRQSMMKLPHQWKDIWSTSFSYDNKYLIVYFGIRHHVPGKKDTFTNRTCLFNLSTGAVKRISNVSLFFSTSPYEHKLAYQKGNTATVYDYEHNKRHSIKIRGEVYGHITMSPDGKLIAYTCSLNPFTDQGGFDVQVADMQTGASATVIQNARIVGSTGDLLWIK